MKTQKPKKKSVERNTEFAEGGRGQTNKMFGEQAANPQKPGGTAHAVKGAAPGSRAARGGPLVRGIGGLARKALPGQSGT